MAKLIEWSRAASTEYLAIVRYLRLETGSLQAANNFSAAVMDKLDRIAAYPDSGRAVKGWATVRYVTVKAHYRIYYRVVGRRLRIVDLFDTRQNPDKSPY